ncbi:hypothetical protein [Roseimaritima sediminicola]|uniref:hypothetical protein n=1 Tax=Roseimaritima sediminicola TaxID=2662066 RepID=UPI001298417F|nr:hypothetical protein [Roseimaritima sediminicola]
MSTQSSSRTDRAENRETSSGSNESSQQYSQHYVSEPAKDVLTMFRDYAHEKPDVAAMWCFGLGLIVGWKLRG